MWSITTSSPISMHIFTKIFSLQIGGLTLDPCFFTFDLSLILDPFDYNDDFRPSWSITTTSPGSDLAGETSAALAAASIYFARFIMIHHGDVDWWGYWC